MYLWRSLTMLLQIQRLASSVSTSCNLPACFDSKVLSQMWDLEEIPPWDLQWIHGVHQNTETQLPQLWVVNCLSSDLKYFGVRYHHESRESQKCATNPRTTFGLKTGKNTNAFPCFSSQPTFDHALSSSSLSQSPWPGAEDTLPKLPYTGKIQCFVICCHGNEN